MPPTPRCYYDDDRKNTVESHFENINGNNFSDFAYDCTYACAYILQL